MKFKEIIEKLNLSVLTAKDKTDVEVTWGYTSDLLSDVIANSKEGNIWITLQTHQNIIAVARLKELAGIILVNNRKPDEQTLKKAEESAFQVSGRLFGLIHKG
jgi:hypothetical protein